MSRKNDRRNNKRKNNVVAAASFDVREHEAELTARLNGGDSQAFSEVYERYEGRLRRYLISRISDRDTVADMVSDVFLKTWQFLKVGGHITHLPAFLFRATKNILRDFFRRKQKETIPFSHIEGTRLERTLASGKEELGESVDRAMAVERFSLLASELPERQREVVLMRYIEGLKTKEIAHSINLSHANTRVLIHRGMTTIRKRYGDELLPFVNQRSHLFDARSREEVGAHSA